MLKWERFFALCLILNIQLWASIGHVSLLKGEASARRDHQTVALFTSSAVEKNDIITTSANTQMQMTFEDKTVITLGSNSVLNIEEYLNDEQNPQAKFKFSQGTFKSITGQIGKKAPQNFHLETKTATIGIRGTTVIGAIGENGNPDTLGCLSGKIVVMNPLGDVTVIPGYFTTVNVSTPPASPALLQTEILQLFHELSHDTTPLTQQSSSQAAQPNQELLATTSSLTDQTIQLKQQATTSENLITQIDTIEESETSDVTFSSNDFYPTSFKPRLQLASRNVGTVHLSGYATSWYTNSDYQPIPSITDTFILSINSADDSLSNSNIILDRDVPLTLDLSKSADASTMTYKKLNHFTIKDFDNYQGWIVTQNRYPNDYVSWGYWALNTNDDTALLATTNYWVAGIDADEADTRIKTLIAKSHTTSYTYNGHVMGVVSDGNTDYAIDASKNNAVKLNFDFGAGSGSLKNGSYIQFQTEETTPRLWKLSPAGAISSGSFSLQNTHSVTINEVTDNTSYSVINGTFYGTKAQALGGTFSATSSSATATGVFKAAR